MLGAYNIDSDDDEEEEEEEEEVPTNVPKSASSHIKELEKVSLELRNLDSTTIMGFVILSSRTLKYK